MGGRILSVRVAGCPRNAHASTNPMPRMLKAWRNWPAWAGTRRFMFAARTRTGCAHWEHEEVLERVQQRLDKDPAQLAVRSMTVEHPYGTIKSWMGATHFKMRRLRNVATEMALHVLAYNMTRVMNLIGIPALVAAMKA